MESPKTTARIGDKLVLRWGEAPSDKKLIEGSYEAYSRPNLATDSRARGASAVRWDRVGNVFWLGGDLVTTAQTALRGAPKDEILSALNQAYHHISELGLAETPPGQQIDRLRAQIGALEEPMLGRAWRSNFATSIYQVTSALDAMLRVQQRDYRPSSLRKNSVLVVVQTGLLASLNLVETTALRTATATSAGIDVAGARQQHRPPDPAL
jgi:hypothetical protein